MSQLVSNLWIYLLFITLIELTNGTNDFKDTVDLSHSEAFLNGSFSFGETIIPQEFISISKYEVANEHIPVIPDPRGCELKPCVQFCCLLNQRFNGSNCVQIKTFSRYSTVMNITDENGVSQNEDILKIFHQLYNRYADLGEGYLIEQIMEEDFVLFKNGTLLRFFDMAYFSMDEYCLLPYFVRSLKIVRLLPLPYRRIVPDSNKTLVLDAISMFFSVPFMILTIIVYMGTPELRTLHSKLLCCYLFGLCVGYSSLSVVKITQTKPFVCNTLAYLIYFMFMSSFFWLSVISFNVYRNISASHPRNNAFKFYCLYSWGLALVCLIITYTAENTSWISNDLKPSFCKRSNFLNVFEGWSAMIYFYGPLTLIIGFNITMFALTGIYIQSVIKNLSRVMDTSDSRQIKKSERNWFAVFLRLFIVMGVTWTTQIASYLVGEKFENFFILIDICTAMQGLAIFVIFVAKKSVWEIVTKRHSHYEKSIGRSSTRMTNLSTERQSRGLASVSTYSTTAS